MNRANDSLSVQWTVPDKVELLGTSLIISDVSQCVQTMGIHGARHSIIGQIHTDFSPMGNSRCFAGISLAYLPLDYLACDACLNCVLFSTSRCTCSPFVFSCVIYFYLSLNLQSFLYHESCKFPFLQLKGTCRDWVMPWRYFLKVRSNWECQETKLHGSRQLSCSWAHWKPRLWMWMIQSLQSEMGMTEVRMLTISTN